jgi:SAM-dependent methyltransferase
MMNQTIEAVRAPCPVCSYTLATPIFDGGEQPLATLGWAKTSKDAIDMPTYPLDYVQCPRCTHVWNHSFTYDVIPYKKNPNRMFNQGIIWQTHLKTTRDLAISTLPKNPTVIDIGCGEGHFIAGIAEAFGGSGRFLGFDPNGSAEGNASFEFHPRNFDPFLDVIALEPDLLIMRHVLEHLTDPAAFVDQLAWSASQLTKPVRLFAEMPCIDNIFKTNRLVDFFYEHPSQFTTKSFRTLLNLGGGVSFVDQGYGGEVVYGIVELGVSAEYLATARTALKFKRGSILSRESIQSQLSELAASKKLVAIWGGTGKAAAFIHYFEANAQNFPLVVDSDFTKVGTFVPKTGQQIQFRDVLKEISVDVVIVPPQWRAKDIVAEMKREGIEAGSVLIEHGGRLIDFFRDEHPYK